jgi:hypothetical protein
MGAELSPDLMVGVALMGKLASWRGSPEGCITTTEAALRSSYTIVQIATLAKTGRLLGRRVRGRWFIDKLTLDAFIANRKRRPKRGRPARSHRLMHA